MNFVMFHLFNLVNLIDNVIETVVGFLYLKIMGNEFVWV